MGKVKPAFIDASYAAELLRVPVADVLDWVKEGRLGSFGGPERNPFLRLSQVEELAPSLGTDLAEPSKKRRIADDPVRRVALRIRHDAKWSEVSPEDIVNWARGLDAPSRQAARTVVATSMARLEAARNVLEDPSADSRG